MGEGNGELNAPRETTRIWFEEENSPDYHMKLSLKRIMFEGASEFQRVQVLETAQFGKTLVVDGKTQSCLADEFVYHESLVHPAMLSHPNPKTVFIGGGGELATAREVLKYSSVEKCVMVDIDKVVVDICRKELPEWNEGVMDDPRLEVIYDDAKTKLEEYDGKFDVVIMDIADPIEAGPGIVLYEQEFYQDILVKKMNPDGVFVTQSGPCSLYNFTECFTTIHSTLRSVFKHVHGYSSEIPSFGGSWGFNVACNSNQVIQASDVDEAISTRSLGDKLRFYDSHAHSGMFGLGKPFRDGIANEARVMTKDSRVFIW